MERYVHTRTTGGAEPLDEPRPLGDLSDRWRYLGSSKFDKPRRNTHGLDKWKRLQAAADPAKGKS